MTQPMIVKLNADGETVSWRHPAAGEGAGPVAQAPPAGASPVVVLAPAEQILVSEVELPGRNRARLLQALPYALEDQLADDLERYHFALGEATAPGRYRAAAVDRALMDRWQERLRESVLEPAALMPDALALPAPADESSGRVAVDGERALVRIGSSRAYAVGRAELAAFLGLESELRALELHGADRFSLPGVTVSPRRDASLLELLAVGARDRSLNLLQGPYQPAGEKSARAARIWLSAAAVSLIAVALALVEQGLGYRQQAKRVAALEARAGALLKQAFPETARLVDPRVQMERGLDDLRAARGDLGQAGFLYLLRIAGPSLMGTGGVRLDALNYRSDGLVLDVHASDLSRIEAVRQDIRDRSGVAVVLESAATLDDGADGRLRIEGARG